MWRIRNKIGTCNGSMHEVALSAALSFSRHLVGMHQKLCQHPITASINTGQVSDSKLVKWLDYAGIQHQQGHTNGSRFSVSFISPPWNQKALPYQSKMQPAKDAATWSWGRRIWLQHTGTRFFAVTPVKHPVQSAITRFLQSRKRWKSRREHLKRIRHPPLWVQYDVESLGPWLVGAGERHFLATASAKRHGPPTHCFAPDTVLMKQIWYTILGQYGLVDPKPSMSKLFWIQLKQQRVLVGAEAADEMQAMHALQLAQKRAELCSMFSTHLEAWSHMVPWCTCQSRHSAMNKGSYFVYSGSCASIRKKVRIWVPQAKIRKANMQVTTPTCSSLPPRHRLAPQAKSICIGQWNLNLWCLLSSVISRCIYIQYTSKSQRHFICTVYYMWWCDNADKMPYVICLRKVDEINDQLWKTFSNVVINLSQI